MMADDAFDFTLDSDGASLVMNIHWRDTAPGMAGRPFSITDPEALSGLLGAIEQQPTVESVVVRDVRVVHLVGHMMRMLREMVEMRRQLIRLSEWNPLAEEIEGAQKPKMKCARCPIQPSALFGQLSASLIPQFTSDSSVEHGFPEQMIARLNEISHHQDPSPYCDRCRKRTTGEFSHLYNTMVDTEVFARRQAYHIVSNTPKIIQGGEQ
jgi:hypothetical protein